jgi:hypothetical protein
LDDIQSTSEACLQPESEEPEEGSPIAPPAVTEQTHHEKYVSFCSDLEENLGENLDEYLESEESDVWSQGSDMEATEGEWSEAFLQLDDAFMDIFTSIAPDVAW